MLELVETYVAQIRQAKSRQDVEAVLRHIASGFGFRAGAIIAFSSDLRTVTDLLDSNHDRAPLWAMSNSPKIMEWSVEVVRQLAGRGLAPEYAAEEFGLGDDFIAACERLDLVEGVAIPITYRSGIAGVVNFAGGAMIDDSERHALHVLAYLLYATLHGLRETETAGDAPVLTPREREVMAETAKGHTSGEIATLLGLSERTVNQHAENVSVKFGTRNRIHTIAHLVRIGLLD